MNLLKLLPHFTGKENESVTYSSSHKSEVIELDMNLRKMGIIVILL